MSALVMGSFVLRLGPTRSCDGVERAATYAAIERIRVRAYGPRGRGRNDERDGPEWQVVHAFPCATTGVASHSTRGGLRAVDKSRLGTKRADANANANADANTNATADATAERAAADERVREHRPRKGYGHHARPDHVSLRARRSPDARVDPVRGRLLRVSICDRAQPPHEPAGDTLTLHFDAELELPRRYGTLGVSGDALVLGDPWYPVLLGSEGVPLRGRHAVELSWGEGVAITSTGAIRGGRSSTTHPCARRSSAASISLS